MRATPDVPDTRHEPWGRRTDFGVRKRSFVRFHDDQHGGGIVAVLCRSARGENVDRAGRDPERFFLPSFNARHGWLGIRVDIARVDWDDVRGAITGSWRLVAPKSLLIQLGDAPPR